jgi:hypothetical protein
MQKTARSTDLAHSHRTARHRVLRGVASVLTTTMSALRWLRRTILEEQAAPDRNGPDVPPERSAPLPQWAQLATTDQER